MELYGWVEWKHTILVLLSIPTLFHLIPRGNSKLLTSALVWAYDIIMIFSIAFLSVLADPLKLNLNVELISKINIDA